MADTYEIEKSLVMKKATGAGKGQGDERDKAGDVKETGEERATVTDEIKVKSGSTGDQRDKTNDVEEKGEKRAKPVEKSAIDAIVKSWGTSDKSLSFFKFFAKEDKELLKAMSVDKESWKYYMDNHAKEVNKGIKEWE